MKALLKWLKRWWVFYFVMPKETRDGFRQRRQAIDDIARIMISRMDPNYRRRYQDMTNEELEAECAQIEKRQKELREELEACKARTRQYRAEAAEHRAETRRLQREHAAWKESR